MVEFIFAGACNAHKRVKINLIRDITPVKECRLVLNKEAGKCLIDNNKVNLQQVVL